MARGLVSRSAISSMSPGDASARAFGFVTLGLLRTLLEFADRFDGLRARLGNENDRTAFVTERPAHVICEMLFVLVGEKFVAIHEHEKRRRRLAHLRGVIEFQAMARRADGLTTIDRIAKRAIENRSGNLLLQFSRNVTHRFEQAIEMETRLG